MIGKREVLDMAVSTGLNPHIIEKDYALGWALAGIFAHEALAPAWVFKGGTCLKKCYFETYRFSEDLDFTLLDESHLDGAFLARCFAEIADWIYEQSGLEFPADSQDFDIYENPRGKLSCQGKLSYRGPVSPRPLPRIKLDLTADERVVLAPVRVPIFHPYSDAPEGGIAVQAYAYEEAFAEKVRALAERTRPRDLYDVVNLYRNVEARPAAAVMRDVLEQKCAFKGIAVPQNGRLDGHRTDLEAAWRGMLAHQLPALPPAESFWQALPEFFAWLEGAVPETPASYALSAGEALIRERTLRLPLRSVAHSHLEITRFAAANRLCVALEYQNSTRTIEPYSLRRTQDNNFVLHAWNVEKNEHRSYRVDRIQGARITDHTFTPRYAVELTPSGPLPVRETERQSSSGFGSWSGSPTRPIARSAGPARPRRTGRPSLGPTYVYQCGMCGKKLSKKTMSGVLRKHKAPGGYPCSGRTGFFVNTRS